MSTVPASVGAPRIAQVNLLPPEVEGKRKRGRTRVVIVLSLLVFMLIMALLWLGSVTLRVNAENALEAEQDRRPELIAELATYDFVNGVQQSYNNSVLARNWAGLTDVYWANYLDALSAAMPPGVVLEEVTVTQANAFGPASGGSNPFVTASVGTVTFVGSATTAISVADMQDAIDAVSGFSDTTVSREAIETFPDTDTVVWQYDGTTNVTFQALSGRVFAAGSPLFGETATDDATTEGDS